MADGLTEITVQQFADNFKAHLAKGDEESTYFMEQMGDKYSKLGRKMNAQDLATEWIAVHPQFQQAYKFTDLSSTPAAPSGQTPAPASAAAAATTKVPGPPEAKRLKEGSHDKLLPDPLKSLRPISEKYVSKATEWTTSKMGMPQGVQQFSGGVAAGIADSGLDLANPMYGATMIGSILLPEGLLAKAPKLVGAIKAVSSVGFGAMSLKNLAQEVPEAAEAAKAGDWHKAGMEVGRALADAYFMTGAYGQGKKGYKAFKTGEHTPTTTGVRGQYEKAVEKVTDKIRGKSAAPPPEPEISFPRQDVMLGKHLPVEERIKVLEKSLENTTSLPDDLPGKADQIEGINATLRDLYHQRESRGRMLDLVREGQQKISRHDYEGGNADLRAARNMGWDGIEKPPPVKPTPGPAIQSEVAGKARSAEAKYRQEHQDPTSIWRKGREGLGQRLWPEETGELPQQGSPQSRPIGGPETEKLAQRAAEKGKGKGGQTTGGAAPPPTPEGQTPPKGPSPIPSPDVIGQSQNPEGRTYTATNVPGIPKGAQIIPHGLTEKGFAVTVIDNGRIVAEKILPFKDSLANMVRKGWMKAGELQGTEHLEPLHREPEAPRQSVTERDVSPQRLRQRGLPAPGSAGPPPGPQTFADPETVGKFIMQEQLRSQQAQASQPRGMIEGPPDPSKVTTPKMGEPEQLEAAKQQPTEIIQNFIKQMRESFKRQVEGMQLDPDNKKHMAIIQPALDSFNKYLEPYFDILRERGVKEGVPKKQGPKKGEKVTANEPKPEKKGKGPLKPPVTGAAAEEQAAKEAAAKAEAEKKAAAEKEAANAAAAAAGKSKGKGKGTGAAETSTEVTTTGKGKGKGKGAKGKEQEVKYDQPHSKIEGFAGDLIDHTIKPGDPNGWRAVNVRVVDLSKNTMHEEVVPAWDFTEDYVKELSDKNPGRWAIEISNPNALHPEKRLAVFPKEEPGPPPKPE